MKHQPVWASRAQSAMAVFVLMIGLAAGVLDALHVIRTSGYLFSGLLDRIVFVLFSFSLYAVVGLIAGLCASLVPLALFPGASRLQPPALPGFYLSLFVGLVGGFVLAVEQITFTRFNQQLWSNLAVLVTIAAAVYLTIVLLMKLLTRATGLGKFVERIGLLLVNKISVTAIVLILLGTGYQVTSLSANLVSTGAGHPNIILISLDTLGASHVGVYGYDKPTTPHIDQFAAEGTLFENYFTASRITLPSHMTMFTSVYPSVHRVIDSFASVLDDKFLTLAEILAKDGYQTGAFVDGDRALNIGAAHGFDQGFAFYEHYPQRFFKHEKLYLTKRLYNFVENFLHRHGIPDMHSDKIFGGALSWIDGRKTNAPFFLFLHTYDIHGDFGTKLPYVAPPEYSNMIKSNYHGDFNGCGASGTCATSYLVEINKKIRRGAQPAQFLSEGEASYIATLYDRGVRYTDDEVGKFLAQLRNLNVLDNTIVMLTSDHGEEFFQHQQLKHVQYYDEVLKVPLIIRYPAKLRPGTRVPELSRSIDLAPTLLDLAGLPHRFEQFQGVSLVAKSDSQRVAFAGQDHPSMDAETRVVRTLKYKYIKNGSDRLRYSFNLERPEELYDLITDPGENTNLIGAREDVHKEMTRLMDKWSSECWALQGQIMPAGLTKKVKIDKKAAEALKSLGYVK